MSHPILFLSGYLIYFDKFLQNQLRFCLKEPRATFSHRVTSSSFSMTVQIQGRWLVVFLSEFSTDMVNEQVMATGWLVRERKPRAEGFNVSGFRPSGAQSQVIVNRKK